MSNFNRPMMFAFFLFGLVLSSPGQAQFASIFKDTDLTAADISAAEEAGRRLFASGAPVPGTKIGWRNETSKSFGFAKIATVSEDRRCAVVEHSLNAKGSEVAEVLRFKRCMSSDGRWLLE
ncbi:hypothetical protein [Ovoidimarina sediminis]|uniref:hypothetical protein n=1 Tax=Ovoidimarina sediminis TaxID=3079856 RepID=UPI0029061981|nr:hypothetical protein [Rhodophyticola sp. MJ-SS7]MDU8944273.1 hypothetical protein [Rhodophyticola sp. MJ-SS7]